MPGTRVTEFDIRTQCAFYARKYRHQPERLEKGLVAYAVHLFAQERGFDAVLDGEATAEATLACKPRPPNDLQGVRPRGLERPWGSRSPRCCPPGARSKRSGAGSG